MKFSSITILEILTFLAVLVALYGERFWKYRNKLVNEKQIKAILKSSLDQLQQDLLRIRHHRSNNHEVTNEDGDIKFSTTSFSEVSGYHFLFSDLFLPNAKDLDLRKYPKTIRFFNHYKMNIATLENRINQGEKAILKLGTVNNLLGTLKDTILEFS